MGHFKLRMEGSSPRAWGKRHTHPVVSGTLKRPSGFASRFCRRLIPASMGKTMALVFTSRFSRAHPRKCGETQLGSPTNWRRAEHPRVCREMVKEALTQAVRLVHPLMWGNCSALNSRLTSPGSSPRAWGKRVRRVHRILRERIIPARVGETPFRDRSAGDRLDHPRARGGNGPDNSPPRRFSGSSPRAWGKHRGGWGDVPLMLLMTDHPRARGGNRWPG